MLGADTLEEQLALHERSYTGASAIRRAPRHVASSRLPRADISIKAVNHDNRRNGEQLADLFRRCYGASYPAKEVYDPEHWYSPDNDCFNAELGHCMTSMVAVDDSRIVAHMALRHEPHARRVEFLYPAIHPAYRKRVFEFCRLFWETIEDLAQRQRWELVYFYNVLAHPMWQLVANKCFDSIETAVIPIAPKDGKAFVRRPDSRSSFLVMCNTFEARHSSPRPFFAPKEHREFIASQFEQLGLLRIPERNPSPDRNAYPSGCGGGARLVHKAGFGIYNVLIDPEKLQGPAEIALCTEQLSQRQQERCVLSIAMDRPEALPVCESVKQQGYRFCGIQPLDHGRDRLLFAKFDPAVLNSISLYSSQAKRLRDHIDKTCRDSRFSYH